MSFKGFFQPKALYNSIILWLLGANLWIFNPAFSFTEFADFRGWQKLPEGYTDVHKDCDYIYSFHQKQMKKNTQIIPFSIVQGDVRITGNEMIYSQEDNLERLLKEDTTQKDL